MTKVKFDPAHVRTCVQCFSHYRLAWDKGTTLTEMIQADVCYICARWNLIVRFWDPLEPKNAIIGGRFYYIADEKSPLEPRGGGGRRFVISFHDGRVVTTTNLWECGQIPENRRDVLADTAVFTGAEFVVMELGR